MVTEPLHILLADDDEGDRLLFKEAFFELKINTLVTTVHNGTQLMEWLHMNLNHLPHFIFLDLNMPRKGGLACLKEIKNDEKLKDISVAIYSTSDNERDKEEVLYYGANAYIVKPNNFEKLKEILEKSVMTV